MPAEQGEQLSELGGRNREKQTAAGLSVTEQNPIGRRGLPPIHDAATELQIIFAAAGHAVLFNQIINGPIDRGNGGDINNGGNGAGPADGGEMSDQAEAGDVSGGAGQSFFCDVGADRIKSAHESNGRANQRTGREAAFDGGGDNPGAERFGQDKEIVRPSFGVGQKMRQADDAGDSQAVNRFRAADGMSADDGAFCFARLLQAAAQNRGNGGRGEDVSREGHDIERGERTSAHRENVGKRVGGRDLPVGGRVVHDRCKKIDRLDEGMGAVETVDTGIVARAGIDEDVTAPCDWKLRQDLPQRLLAEFGSSACA